MMTVSYQHAPVMAKEAVEYLKPAAGKVLVDATLGGGGHAEKLRAGLRVIAFDRDADAISAAKTRLSRYENITYIRDSFTNLKKHIKQKIDGILFDLGVSSYQIDEPSRGFSFQQDGPLDMRMDQNQKLTASDIVNHFSSRELEQIFRNYGEERFSKRISNAICATRNAKKIQTTFELKGIVEKAIPSWKKRDSVARVFQSLRIAVNDELENLRNGLKDAIDILKPGGRIVVLSYHSLEDRIVKHAFRGKAKEGVLKVLTKKPIIPGRKEIEENPRAKSAKLRAAEKL